MINYPSWKLNDNSSLQEKLKEIRQATGWEKIFVVNVHD